ncbi:MAG: hypothetical protein C0473_00370 [Cyanobacteria bacterium DS3.002]|nr:hypothetical protein [Cyanobacteria bacterium DS3.002]MBA4050255.1 hypothetical protein [Cyanobacteria bacterium DS2.008]
MSKRLEKIIFKFLDSYAEKAKRDRIAWLKSRVGINPSPFRRVVRRIEATFMLYVRKLVKREQLILVAKKSQLNKKLQELNYDYDDITETYRRRRSNTQARE